MSTEIKYDQTNEVKLTEAHQDQMEDLPKSSELESSGCHSKLNKEKSLKSIDGNNKLLDKFKKDYPLGPHDKPQSMCPAFGSLRVGLRMRRVATILSGSACCVYGLTFVSHFYGARRSVGYVPFSSETLVSGKLFEDIRESVHKTADPSKYDAIIVTNLCVPTASGVPLRLLPNEIMVYELLELMFLVSEYQHTQKLKMFLQGLCLIMLGKKPKKAQCQHHNQVNLIDQL